MVKSEFPTNSTHTLQKIHARAHVNKETAKWTHASAFEKKTPLLLSMGELQEKHRPPVPESTSRRTSPRGTPCWWIPPPARTCPRQWPSRRSPALAGRREAARSSHPCSSEWSQLSRCTVEDTHTNTNSCKNKDVTRQQQDRQQHEKTRRKQQQVHTSIDGKQQQQQKNNNRNLRAEKTEKKKQRERQQHDNVVLRNIWFLPSIEVPDWPPSRGSTGKVEACCARGEQKRRGASECT